LSQEQRGERGFIVVDKRGNGGEESAGAAPAEKAARELPRPDFAALAISLGHSALYHLGLVPDPATGKQGSRDLALARQSIDTLEMLEGKTKGNLSADEARLLEDLLYDLRMRFVEASK
jgi:hypothetical protein